MVIKNKATKKEYPISKEKWEDLKPGHKELFIVVDDSELKTPERQQVSNVVEKKEAPNAKKGTAPSTGDKKGNKK